MSLVRFPLTTHRSNLLEFLTPADVCSQEKWESGRQSGGKRGRGVCVEGGEAEWRGGRGEHSNATMPP